MIRELSEKEFQDTFGVKMTNITQLEIDNPVEIWKYVAKLREENLILTKVLNQKIIEGVYRNDSKTFDHVLIPSKISNIFVVIIVDLVKKNIFGHFTLDLNEKYGITTNRKV
ncbi:MAG: hypothetical protein DWQ02_25050 [Bacteroidetes bacterium]|nr:MAG: hypothetical protein DWQ02_25050 [Bacteroidota bacterium]